MKSQQKKSTPRFEEYIPKDSHLQTEMVFHSLEDDDSSLVMQSSFAKSLERPSNVVGGSRKKLVA